ncbi:hypothetical protein FACS1894188_04980 [Clostridia bacterium]|nr:hypothetical protein FACS1894188_04980 [Clostridia bacterium]
MDTKYKSYVTRISSATSFGLTLVTYELAAEFIKTSEESLQKNDRDEYEKFVEKSRGAVKILIDALDYNVEISLELFGLYSYIDSQLAAAYFTKDTEKARAALTVARELLYRLYQSFKEIDPENYEKTDLILARYEGYGYSPQ